MLIPYFPNPFSQQDYNSILTDTNTEFNLQNPGFNSKYQFINSASQGIYLLLKSFDLKIGDKVGLPPLLCNSVTDAILKAGLFPYYFDINNDFILKFDENHFGNSGIKALILPHLYGALHPKTEEIVNWCKKKRVFLISDTAQSFGLKFFDTPAIELGDGGVYSFGFGKASSCAGGAIVYNLTHKIVYSKNPIIKLFNNNLSHFNLASRTYGLATIYKNNFSKRYYGFISQIVSDYILDITKLQINSIIKFWERRKEIYSQRMKNFMILKNKLNSKYFVVPKSFSESLKFKYVFTINSDSRKLIEFISNMRQNGIEIQHCSRTDKTHTNKVKLDNYNNLKYSLFEISTESSIPEENLYKAAEVMNSYFDKS